MNADLAALHRLKCLVFIRADPPNQRSSAFYPWSCWMLCARGKNMLEEDGPQPFFQEYANGEW
jgi:hypothetical protein